MSRGYLKQQEIPRPDERQYDRKITARGSEGAHEESKPTHDNIQVLLTIWPFIFSFPYI
jgi:hypothetical protein